MGLGSQNSDAFWGLEIFFRLSSQHLEWAEDFLYKTFGRICPGQPVKRMFQLLPNGPNVHVECLATYSICGYKSDCVCARSVAQPCSTLCDAMDCPWDSPGKNTGGMPFPSVICQTIDGLQGGRILKPRLSSAQSR